MYNYIFVLTFFSDKINSDKICNNFQKINKTNYQI
jgi:hypothetical protein